jgi:hypothetical protein
MSCLDKHHKEVAGISDMKQLAEQVGDLHYEALSEFMAHLSDKIRLDATKDRTAGRLILARHLGNAQKHIQMAWELSRPYMK